MQNEIMKIMINCNSNLLCDLKLFLGAQDDGLQHFVRADVSLEVLRVPQFPEKRKFKFCNVHTNKYLRNLFQMKKVTGNKSIVQIFNCKTYYRNVKK